MTWIIIRIDSLLCFLCTGFKIQQWAPLRSSGLKSHTDFGQSWTWTIKHTEWTFRMNLWTNSCHFPNTEQSSRHSWCECYFLDRPKMKQYQKEVRKIFCLLSNSCVFQSNMKVDHSIFKSGYEQKLGKSTHFFLRVDDLLNCEPL